MRLAHHCEPISRPAVTRRFFSLSLAVSSIVNFKIAGAVPKQALGDIKLPVLIYHHQDDACKRCQPHEVPNILAGLKNAPVKKLMMVSGGASNPPGPVCEALHWHGFIGIEPQAVADITAWMTKPSN